MIFGLFADDVNKVRELYANYNGGLTQNEIDYVTRARRGDALFILDINTRLPIHIDVFEGEIKYLEPVKETAAAAPVAEPTEAPTDESAPAAPSEAPTETPQPENGEGRTEAPTPSPAEPS